MIAGSSPPGRLPPSPLRFVPCIFIARRCQLFLPSSTRVEWCLPTLVLSAVDPFFSSLFFRHGGIRGLPLVRRGDEPPKFLIRFVYIRTQDTHSRSTSTAWGFYGKVPVIVLHTAAIVMFLETLIGGEASTCCQQPAAVICYWSHRLRIRGFHVLEPISRLADVLPVWHAPLLNIIYIHVGYPDACHHGTGNPSALRASRPFYRREVDLFVGFFRHRACLLRRYPGRASTVACSRGSWCRC